MRGTGYAITSEQGMGRFGDPLGADARASASHLRTQRLGEFTVGSDLHRSDALALTQLLLLYHLVTARAVIALGGQNARATSLAPEQPAVTDALPAASG